MELTEEQIEFLDNVCDEMTLTKYLGNDKFYEVRCKSHWGLNSDGEVDVFGLVVLKKIKKSEIPVKFGKVDGNFYCSYSNLTTLKNFPKIITPVEQLFDIRGNNLTDYFRNIKDENFPHWDKLVWGMVLLEYPFLVNIGKKYFDRSNLEFVLDCIPQTKLYLE